MKRLILIFITTIYSIVLAAVPSIDFKNIGLREGLSNGFATDITIDGQGFLWVATESGLNRIAGNKCTVFKTNNSGISSDGHVQVLYDKRINSVWIVSKNGNVNLYDCALQIFSKPSIPTSLTKKGISNLAMANDNGIWIGCNDGCIAYYNIRNGSYQILDKKRILHTQNGIRCLMDDGNDHLFIGLRMNGMYLYNIRTHQSKFYSHSVNDKESLPGNNVRAFLVDSYHNIWVGTNLGLALFDASEGKFKNFKHRANDATSLVSDNIHGITETKDHKLWIASDIGGISILDIKEYQGSSFQHARFEQITKENSHLSANNTRRVLQDDFGNLWICNYSSGIDFVPSTTARFQTLVFMGSPIENANGLYTDKAGNLWVGQDNRIILYKNGLQTNIWNFPSQLINSTASVYVFKEDHLGNIWIGTNDNGTLKFIPQTGVFTHIGCASSLDIHALYEDKNGKMWIGSECGLFSVNQGMEKTESKMNRNMGGQPIIYSITEDNYGQLWIGTLSDGVYVFNKNEKLLTHLYTKNQLASNTINHIIKDADGGIWIATSKGLTYIQNPLKPQQVRNYDERQGIKDSHIRAICQDKQGNIWVSMFTGIACFDVHKQRFYNYDYESGIPTGNFVEASVTMTPEGTLYFGSPGGVCYFNPQLLSEKEIVSPVQIIGCERVGKLAEQYLSRLICPEGNREIHLAHDDNTFKIMFTVKNYAQEGDVEYSYMMKGLDDQWYETEGDNEVTFRNLEPGDYTFMIRAKLKNQDWEDASTAEMKVVVNPPLWLTWWAKLGYTLFILGLIVYFFRSYQKELLLRNSLAQAKWESKQKQELNEERLRFFTNITHELRTPLTLIMGPLEDLLADNSLSERVNKKIGNIHTSAERLLNLINEILEFRKTQTQNRKLTVARADLGAWVKEIGTRFQDLNHNPKVSMFVNIQDGVSPIYFDSEVVYTVINNLMSNAIKYTQSGSITLSLTQPSSTQVEIAVEDTGYGIDKEALPHICDRYYQENGKHQASGTGIGLALVKSLAKLHEAKLDVVSEKGKGSKFSFTMDANNTYPNALHKDDEQAELDVLIDSENAEKAQENSEKASVFASDKNQEEQHPLLLIVEDNNDIRQYIEESLQEDYRIIQACNGKEGRDMAFEQMPALIVSDIMMPEMDGIEMTKILKEDIRTSHIPIILLTAKTSINDQEEGYDSGADSYLMKPFSAKLLQSRIKNLLASRRRLTEYIVQKNMNAFENVSSNSKGKTEDVETNYPTEYNKGNNEEQSAVAQLNPLDQRFMDKLNKLIEENISINDLDIAFFTDKMAMSHSTFYRKVKALTGMSANEYVKKAKLRHSMKLLLSLEYNSISEVAMLAGFNNLGNFRESFKREFGKSPSEILKKK